MVNVKQDNIYNEIFIHFKFHVTDRPPYWCAKTPSKLRKRRGEYLRLAVRVNTVGYLSGNEPFGAQTHVKSSLIAGHFGIGNYHLRKTLDNFVGLHRFKRLYYFSGLLSNTFEISGGRKPKKCKYTGTASHASDTAFSYPRFLSPTA